MIGRLRGVLAATEPDRVLVETSGGVGYDVIVAPRLLMDLPERGQPVTLAIHTLVRDDDIALYGFANRTDRAVFRLVMTVQGIGPKLAMAIVGTTHPEALASAIAREDVAALARIPGLGAKTAGRLVLELKDKLDRLLVAEGVDVAGVPAPADAAGPLRDAEAALAALGYNPREIKRALSGVDVGPDDTVQSLLRRALKALSPA